MFPSQAAWPVAQAKAVSCFHSLETGLAVLYDALLRFPDEAQVHFYLACFEARLGHLDLARKYLAAAERLMPEIRELVKETHDLAAL